MTFFGLAASTAAPTPGPWHLFGTFSHDVWAALTSSPWTSIGATLFLLSLVTRLVRAVVYPSSIRDEVRRFSRVDKADILRRAGWRCERHGVLTGRCRETETLEADHVIPWSRSGPTIVGNGQALCKRHNRAKSATIPFGWQLRGLAKRRLTYFPEGQSTEVVRRRPRSVTSSPDPLS